MKFRYRPTERQTNRPTDQPKDRQSDSYIAPITNCLISSEKKLSTPGDFPAFRLRTLSSTSSFSKHGQSSTTFWSEIVLTEKARWSKQCQQKVRNFSFDTSPFRFAWLLPILCGPSILELSSDNHLVDGPTNRPTDRQTDMCKAIIPPLLRRGA
ncbi:hypothetical protein DPMN_189082 [Dreissena polymorpha]|uniref:Uncharacterized protein n=1 Tax=Dreissena polymorpha TaxID=45954 RepID=A0A9D4DUY1_DREPO|nr:hypothetical protein DPMN_189082 [Dreissena polymorpha]